MGIIDDYTPNKENTAVANWALNHDNGVKPLKRSCSLPLLNEKLVYNENTVSFKEGQTLTPSTEQPAFSKSLDTGNSSEELNQATKAIESMNIKDPIIKPSLKTQKSKHKDPYRGLGNLGGTCYLNATLQVLFMTKDFRDAVLGTPMDKNVGLVSALKKLFEELTTQNSNAQSVSTWEIIKCLRIQNVNMQQDAVEHFLDILEKIGPDLSKVFRGTMRNSTKCSENHESHDESPFKSLQIPVLNSDGMFILEDGLELYFKPTALVKDDQMYCDSCDKKSDTYWSCKIQEYPPILSLHLKRFTFNYRYGAFLKNDCPMDVPLNLRVQECDYTLYAVINHMGGSGGGHYNAVIRSFTDKKWYCFNDSCVTETDESKMKGSRDAYLLLYQQTLSNTLLEDETEGDIMKAVEPEKTMKASCSEEGGRPEAKWPKPSGKSADTKEKPNTIKAKMPVAATAAPTTASTTNGAATSEKTPNFGTADAQENTTTVPISVTTNKSASTGFDIDTAEGERDTVYYRNTSDSEDKLDTDSGTAANGTVNNIAGNTADPNNVTVDMSANAETTTPAEMNTHNATQTSNEAVMVTPEAMSVKTELEVASSCPTRDPAVSVESVKAELKMASSVPKRDVEFKPLMEVVVSTACNEQTSMEVMETQRSEVPTRGTVVIEGSCTSQEIKIENEDQMINFQPAEPFETNINHRSSDQTHPAEKDDPATIASDSIPTSDPASDLPSSSYQTVSNSAVQVTPASNRPQTVSQPFDDKTLDFPPALELPAHQKMLKRNVERCAAEKTTKQVPSSSKKPPSSDESNKSAEVVKKTTQSESKSVTFEKEKKPQNSSTGSSQEKEAVSRHRSIKNSEDFPSTRYSTPSSGSSSQTSRCEFSPPSKRSRGHDDEHRS
ncbi:ubiquitin carboxyl-terminal hydrolase 36-like [Myxocyprinus asiaticus]|uniref:ubiquitin carboxyl-terminal hydrolase 36-like n=1 Tax=Myxocyprinus asiaticus TaxID=70543 RepID=UPI00222167BA|nr:ubiquitin carboxyl-terminal hydrolase 36-like [Myxocyprinus asiaticus]